MEDSAAINSTNFIAAGGIKIQIPKTLRMADKKPCRVCNFTRQKSYGVVVPSLDDLKTKGEYFNNCKSSIKGDTV